MGGANRFLALGDSYTIGESVARSERWPVQLVSLLRVNGFAVDEPEIVAATGWTTDGLAGGITAARLAGPYALVSLLIGVNNQYRGRDLEEYREQFCSLLRRAIEFAAGEPRGVIVISIPDWGVTPFAEGRDRKQIAREIDAFNDVNREEAARAGAHYVDVTGISRAPANRALVATDGLHPPGEMYRLWAEATLPTALRILTRP
ncbi:MAG: lysophospholipase [Anaerolinea sp.]|nr:lysophospholipase [Anaerolinea sp.]